MVTPICVTINIMKKIFILGTEFLRKFYYWIFLSLAAAGNTVFAQAISPIDDYDKDDVIKFFNNTASFVQQIFWAVAIIAVFYAAFLYATAAGNEQKVETAKKSLLYAVIAIAIGVMAFGITPLVRSFLGGSSGGGGGGGGIGV